MNLRWVILILCSFLWFCAKNDSLTGGSTTVGNGIVAGRVYSPEHQPVSGASVSLYAYTGAITAEAPVHTTTSDIAGAFELTNIQPGSYSLLATSEHDSLLSIKKGINVETDDEVSVDTMFVKVGGDVSGELGFSTDSLWTVVATIPGIPAFDIIEAGSMYILKNIPAVGCSVMVFGINPLTMDTSLIAFDTVTVISDTPLILPAMKRIPLKTSNNDTLLLEHFDDGDKWLPNLRSTWWTYTDATEAAFEATTVSAEFSDATGYDNTGFSAHVKAGYDAQNTDGYVGFGCSLDNVYSGLSTLYDLKNLSAVSFWVKGSALELKLVLYSPIYKAYNTLYVTDALNADWTLVQIDMDSVVAGMSPTELDRWKQTGGWIEQMTFNLYKNEHPMTHAELFVDEIKLIFKP